MRYRLLILLGLIILSGQAGVSATPISLATLPAECDGVIHLDVDATRQAYASSVRGSTSLASIFDVIPFLLGNEWINAVRILEKYADGDCVVGYKMPTTDLLGNAVLVAGTKAKREELLKFLAPSASGVSSSTDPMTPVITGPVTVFLREGRLIVSDDAALVKGVNFDAVDESSPWTAGSVSSLRERSGGNMLFAYARPGPVLDSLDVDAGAMGLDACRGLALGLGPSNAGRQRLRVVLDGDFKGGLLGAALSPARPLDCYPWLATGNDGLIALTIDGKKGMDFLRSLFADNPKILDDALLALRENMGISVDAVLASILPEQVVAFSGLKKFGPENMTINNILLFQNAGVLAFKTHDTTLLQSLAGLVRTFLETNVADKEVDGVPMTVANLFEIDKQPLFQAFLGRKEGWTLGTLTESQYLNAYKQIDKAGNAWASSPAVKEVFGGPPPDSSALVYANLPPELAWPLLQSAAQIEPPPMPGAFKSTWRPVAVNVSRETDAIVVEVHSTQVIDTARAFLIAITSNE